MYVSAIEKRTPGSSSGPGSDDVGVGSTVPPPIDDPKDDDDDAPGDDPQVAVAMETQ